MKFHTLLRVSLVAIVATIVLPSNAFAWNLQGSCAGSPLSAHVGDVITWTATQTSTLQSPSQGHYEWVWSGTDGLSGATQSVSKSYTTPDTKTATVLIKLVLTSNSTESITRTCNVTLTVLPLATLKVIKQVVNDNGGTNTPADFNIHVKSSGTDVAGSPSAGSAVGTVYTLVAGTYTVSETSVPSGYTQTGISGDCAANGGITLAAGASKTCTITNDDAPSPQLVGSCAVTPSTGLVGSSFTWSASASGGTGGFTYAWTGSDGLSGTSATVSKSYTTTGPKSGTVTITSGNQLVSALCSAMVTVAKVCQLEIVKSVDKTTASPGDLLTYTLAYKNTGTADCTGGGVRVDDVVDTKLTFQTETHPAVVDPGYNGILLYDSALRRLTWDANTLVPGQSGFLTWTAKVNEPASCGTHDILNTARITSLEYTPSDLHLLHPSVWVTSNTVKTSVTKNCPPEFSGICSVTPSTGLVGSSFTWSAEASGGAGNYTYSWSGTDGLSGGTETATKSYTVSGTKNGTVVITSGNQSILKSCAVTVTEPEVVAFDAACSVSPSSAFVGESVGWGASASGGTGPYSYSWSGDGNLSGTATTVSNTYSSAGTKLVTVSITSGLNSIDRTCSVFIKPRACESGCGGGGFNQPNVVLFKKATTSSLASASIYLSQVPYSFTPASSSVYLSQIPYTGVVADTLNAVVYIVILLASSGFITYLFFRKRNGDRRLFKDPVHLTNITGAPRAVKRNNSVAPENKMENNMPEFISWLVSDDSPKVFDYLRSLKHQDKDLSKFVTDIASELDLVYRNRIDAQAAVPSEQIKKAVEGWSNKKLEDVISVLVGSVDESYRSNYTPIKLAMAKIMKMWP